MHGGLGCIDGEAIHHLDGGGHDAAADDRGHRFAGLVDGVKTGQ